MTEHIYGTAGGETLSPIGEQREGDGHDGRTDIRDETTTHDATGTHHDSQDDSQDLFAGDDAALFRERWQHVQSRFVDDPRGAVADADALVSDVTKSLASRFADQKTTLEQQWSKGDDAETEDLRQTMQRYRTLFERLLAA